MIGAYISDDFYFFLYDPKSIAGSRNTYISDFVCSSNTEPDKYLRMKLEMHIDYGKEGNPPSSRIDILFKKKVCILVFSEEDFNDWFVNPTDHVRDNGPNWRYASSNVYIKTTQSKDFNTFRNDIISFMSRAPEPPRPNYAKIRSFKKKEKSRKNNAG